MITMIDRVVLGWIALSSFYAVLLFGLDKSRARNPGKSRTSEFHLLITCALGGWLGGFFGMLLFRHKTAKPTFKIKFALSFIVWSGLLWAYWNRRAFIA